MKEKSVKQTSVPRWHKLPPVPGWYITQFYEYSVYYYSGDAFKDGIMISDGPFFGPLYLEEDNKEK